MAEEKKNKISFFDGVKAEFNKISWPDQNALLKQSVAVVCSSLAVGVVIAILDLAIQYGISFIAK